MFGGFLGCSDAASLVSQGAGRDGHERCWGSEGKLIGKNNRRQ